MSKGFLVFAQNTDTVDYVRQAYALALSIKTSQHTVTDISLVTNTIVPEEYKSVFDQIISIPWWKEEGTSLQAEHRWKLYHSTPYDETIVLDGDMLFLDDVSDWWEHLSNHEIKFCSRVLNYKGQVIGADTYHRKAFIANNLPNPYYALHYFKKTDKVLAFYKALEFVINNWELCYGKFAPKEYQNWVSMDLSSAIAIDIVGLHGDAIDAGCPLEFVHMKAPLQGWTPIPLSWQEAVPVHYNKNKELLVGNIKQPKLFHYVEKNFLTDTLLAKLEDACTKN